MYIVEPGKYNIIDKISHHYITFLMIVIFVYHCFKTDTFVIIKVIVKGIISNKKRYVRCLQFGTIIYFNIALTITTALNWK
jgi:hypothetical protein